jgi:hypothetical protein
MQIRNLTLIVCTLVLAAAIRLHAGASGGGGVIIMGTVKPGPGATFTQFHYIGEAAGTPVTLVQAQDVALGLPTELNALLAGPTDGTNILDSIGFSNGSVQLIPGAVPFAAAQILGAAATSGLIGSLDPVTASITNQNLTVSFVQLGTFKFVTVYNVDFTAGAPVMPVGIMIKPPASPPVPINPGASGTIPVAVLSSPTFDATTQVDRTSVRFGHTGTEVSLFRCNPGGEDVNGDSFLDVVCHFFTQKTGLAGGDTMGFLQGVTVSGYAIQGSEPITIVPR